ncbi:Pro-neuregulin-1, membrane-bound isoform [Acipenser ruthenus]|uniref:Pro-neuregulin-1, membrane-bound isoform n=1 Tax=Acipenser ruthenus TaxID=7906 RepID=A0A444UF95_ACIRT|nr:Pro-neuregulin-1, membrane-bound isoform [Acipenser ruthenus]
MSEKKTGRGGNKGKNKNEGKEKVDTAPAEDTSEQAAPKLKNVKSVEVEEGKKVVLKCEASEGNPRPVLTWYKDGKQLKGKNKPKDIKIKQKKTGNSSDIQIPKAKLSHAGTYTCEAANSQGIVQSAGNITVIPGPQATTPPTPPPTTPPVAFWQSLNISRID